MKEISDSGNKFKENKMEEERQGLRLTRSMAITGS